MTTNGADVVIGSLFHMKIYGAEIHIVGKGLIKDKLHTHIYGNSGTISISEDVYEELLKTVGD